MDDTPTTAERGGLDPSLPVLLGDSIFKRLYASNQKLFCTVSERFCVSGQTVLELLSLVRVFRNQLKGRKVVVLIGTNDVLKGHPSKGICSNIRFVVRLLSNLKCDITLCELLPIPKFGLGADSSPSVGLVNKYIRSFATSKVKVVKVFDSFCSDGQICCHLFHKTLGRSKRVDLVHPNADGLIILLLALEAV